MARAGDLRSANRQLRSEVAYLRARLAAAGVQTGQSPPAWTARFTPTQAAILGVLLDRHPRCVDPYQLEELTRVNDHAFERDVAVVHVMVTKLRKQLGRDAIVTVRGCGLMLSDSTAAALRAEAGA